MPTRSRRRFRSLLKQREGEGSAWRCSRSSFLQSGFMKRPTYFKHGDRIAVLDLFADFAFKSAGSVSFRLGLDDDHFDCPDGTSLKCKVFKVLGSIDVHYPCDDHIKVRFVVRLPTRYHTPEQLHELVQQVLRHLAIPADETFEADVSSYDVAARLEQAVDRNGLSDRI